MSCDSVELSEGVSFEVVEGPLIEKLKASQEEFSNGFVRIQPYNQVFPREFLKFEKRLKNFEVREQDIWVASFPKCGTTWTQEMVWNIVNNLDFETAKKVTLDDRVPYFELSSIVGEAVTDDFENSLKKVEEMDANPRIIKTHLSFEMLPSQIMEKQAKVIYVTRNPRDTAVSYFNHWKVLEGYKGCFDDFMELFIHDICGYYTPFVGHVLSYWKQIHRPNICFITFEDMKKDLAGVIQKVGQFLGTPVKEEDLPALVKHLSFDSMKKNKAVNKSDFVEKCNKAFGVESDPESFMRKGQTGNWRQHFTPEWEQKFNDWEQKWLKDSDFSFVYDL